MKWLIKQFKVQAVQSVRSSIVQKVISRENMTIKNILSGVAGGIIGATLLFLLEYNNYFNLGYIGSYVLLLFIIIGIISALVIDYKISKSSTQLIRTLIGFIAYIISLLTTSSSDFGTVSLAAIGIILLLGLGMSLIIAQIFKY